MVFVLKRGQLGNLMPNRCYKVRPSMRITEIYASVQGETQYAGLPCTLIRTTGCDLRCTYCDTTYSFYGGKDMSLDEILAEAQRLGPRLVLLTGGEPMLQREIVALSELLLASGFAVMIETGGAHPVDVLPEAVAKIVDVKTPSSGESHRMHPRALEPLGQRDAVKFVLGSERDYEWARDFIAVRGLSQKTQVLLAPVHGQVDPRELVQWMLRDRLDVRLNLQLHKYIWGPEAQGV